MVTRKERMVDEGEKEAELTFDLGKPATKKETEDALKLIKKLEKEDEQR